MNVVRRGQTESSSILLNEARRCITSLSSIMPSFCIHKGNFFYKAA
jgi:hypothetical protein